METAVGSVVFHPVNRACPGRNQNGTFADLSSSQADVGAARGMEVRLRDWHQSRFGLFQSMNRLRRVWWWGIGLVALVAAAIAYQHLAPRWALNAYKARLRAQGVPLTLEECAPPRVTEQMAGAKRFLAAVQSLPNWSPALPTRLPGSMQMVGPGLAKAGWRQPHLGYANAAAQTYAQTRLLMVKRYGLEAVAAAVTADAPTEDAPGPATWSDLESELEACAPLLEEMDQASRVDAFNWNLDYSQGFSLLLPHLAPCKTAMEFLMAATQVAMREGRFDEATALMETQLRVVRNMEQEGLLINELVRIAMATIAWGGTWEALQAEGFTDAQLARLQKAWEDVRPVEGMIRALRQERALGLLEYARCRKSPRHLANMMRGVGMGMTSGATSSADNFIEAAIEWLKTLFNRRGGWVACVWWGWFDAYEDEQRYIETVQTIMDEAGRRLAWVAEHPVPAAGLASDEPWRPSVAAAFEAGSDRRLLAGMVLPSLQTAMSKAFRVQMQREMALAAIALKRHRMRQGDLPETLDALTPELLARVPVDWMDGRPLRYRRLDADRFRLYSVQEDGVDDGGDGRPSNPSLRSFSPYQARDFIWPEEALPPRLTGSDFEAGFRLSSTNTDPAALRLMPESNEPPLWIAVVPRLLQERRDAGGLPMIGVIEVSTGSPPTLAQLLPVWGADPDRLTSGFQALDVNFDGYPDLSTLYAEGAKAARRSLWLYEPASGFYTTHVATAQFREISHHSLALDHERGLIRMTHFSGACTNSWETWRIEGDQLLSLEAVVHVPEDEEHCQVTHLRRSQDEMRVVSDERTTCLKPDPGGPNSVRP